jgi:transglutaminase-like putative cysteine protease
MKFDKLFQIVSYAAVFCGFAALWVSGTLGVFGSFVFFALMAAAWLLEGKRWQLSERAGTVLIVLAIPFYFLAYRFNALSFSGNETVLPGILARLILTLTCIKLLQRKSDRDWMFLYLMSFFEVLLAAGLSISTLYFVSFVAYVFVMVCAIILFEIRKTNRSIESAATVKKPEKPASRLNILPTRRLPVTAFVLIILIACIAMPMFFLLPRVGGAGFGGNSGNSVSASSGFSDSVRLGGIGTIQQNDAVVMRVRVENREAAAGRIRWRGVALDTFDGTTWKRSLLRKEARRRGERDLIQVGYARGHEPLILQTVYLEPLDIDVLFGMPRIVGVQGGFANLFLDDYDSVSFIRAGERISYKVLSDASVPPEADLRADRARYSREDTRYLQLPPNLDSRIEELAEQVTANTRNRYDAAAAVESYLQNEFGYTLQQKAGGEDPLADFLFNVREGHCEYFATAMAVMLRTQGIATRVVNGFQQGEYNEAADAYVVRQRNAHSWVEVYFPGEDAWVTFDPTPAAGQNLSAATNPISARLNKYIEALEMFWIQYFVAFDSQEQRSLFTSIRRGVSNYNAQASSWLETARQTLAEWWQDVRGQKGFEGSVAALLYGAAYLAGAVFIVLLFVWLYRRVVKLEVCRRLLNWARRKQGPSIVEFYDRMQRVLASKGFTRQPHQTPLEFAYAVGLPGAVRITEQYNRVRFGEKDLTDLEAAEIERCMEEILAADSRG